MENVHTVINFAAESHVDRSILNPNDFISTNVSGTANLLLHASVFSIIYFFTNPLFF